ncbi:MAG: ParB/RepB/Spo0J family partition protein [Pseudomonadota bacterium]
MANKRKSLGRGLGALLGDAARSPVKPASTPAAAPATGGEQPTGTLRELGVDLLQRGRYQPRVDMRKDTLQELADSIKAQGIVQPIAVRPLTLVDDTQRYEIIAGERRWRAAQLAGLSQVPVVIHNVSDNEAVAMALIENIQREDLNPLEEARALSRLIEEFELTHQEGADAVGRSRASVSNLLRLLELGEEVQQMLAERQLDMGHARALLGVPAGKQQTTLARLVVAKKLSVRETEKRVREANAPVRKAPPPKRKDPDIVRLEADLTDKLGATVNVSHGRNGAGSLSIAYNSLDELEGILDKIG